MKATIRKEGTAQILVIEIPMQEPQLSATGKTYVVASSRGNKPTDVQVNGKTVTVGLNAYTSR